MFQLFRRGYLTRVGAPLSDASVRAADGPRRRPVPWTILTAVGVVCAGGAIGLSGCNERPNDANSRVGSPSGASEVSFKTDDGWGIFADIYPPVGASRGVVIFLHQRDGAASDWTSLCSLLQADHSGPHQDDGYTALAIDQRGAGRSVQGPGGVGGKGDNAPWETGPDIAAAIKFAAGKGAVALVGASYGANNALIYAAAHPDQVKSVVLFSPGANYNGLDALSAARIWKGPIEIFHAKGDTIAGQGPQAILKATGSTDRKLVIVSGSGHGAELLREALSSTVDSPVKFLERTLK